VVYTDDVGRAALLDQRADDTGLGQCQSGNRGSSDQGRMHLERKVELRDGEQEMGEGRAVEPILHASYISEGVRGERTIVVLH
jgi:hypothetical protein